MQIWQIWQDSFHKSSVCFSQLDDGKPTDEMVTSLKWIRHQNQQNKTYNMASFAHILHEQNLPSIWQNRTYMSETCHQINKIGHIGAKLADLVADPFNKITKSNSYFLSCLKTSVFLTSTEKEKCPWASSSKKNSLERFLHQYQLAQLGCDLLF